MAEGGDCKLKPKTLDINTDIACYVLPNGCWVYFGSGAAFEADYCATLTMAVNFKSRI